MYCLNVRILTISGVHSFSPVVNDCFEFLIFMIAFPKWAYIYIFECNAQMNMVLEVLSVTKKKKNEERERENNEQQEQKKSQGITHLCYALWHFTSIGTSISI